MESKDQALDSITLNGTVAHMAPGQYSPLHHGGRLSLGPVGIRTGGIRTGASWFCGLGAAGRGADLRKGGSSAEEEEETPSVHRQQGFNKLP